MNTLSKEVVTLSDKSSTIKLPGETFHIDSQLLFQRLTTAAGRSIENISEVFKYELCSIPSSLFDNTGLPRQPSKSTLAEALWKLGDCSHTSISNEDDLHFIIDGGSLLPKFHGQKTQALKRYDSYMSTILSKSTQEQLLCLMAIALNIH